mgnify:CR=1 FL=1
MRLYLSSFRNGNKPEELLKLLGEGRRTALICNAMDMVADEAARVASNTSESERLSSIGLASAGRSSGPSATRPSTWSR